MSQPLTPELVEFVERAASSVIVGTCDRDLAPECVRGVGIRIAADARTITVLVPVATGGRTLANLRDNPRLAVAFNEPTTHRTFQIKGQVLAIRAAAEADRALAERFRMQFAEALALLGHLPRKILNLTVWPATAIDVEIDQVFAQTPGPKAGTPLGGP